MANVAHKTMDITNFDPVIDRYDAARHWPDSIVAAFAAVVAYFVPKQAILLEIGIGTGRVAEILKAQHFEVFAIDTSKQSLRHNGDHHVRIAQGNLSDLPFTDHHFAAVYTIQVLHRLEKWEQPLDEIQRVLAQGGMYLNRSGSEVASDVMNHMDVGWYTILKRNGIEMTVRPDQHAKTRFDDDLMARGASCESVRIARWRENYSPRKRLERTRARNSPSLRHIPDSVFTKCLNDYERWLKAQYTNLDANLEIMNEVALDVWRWQ